MRYWMASLLLVVSLSALGCGEGFLEMDDHDGKDEKISVEQLPAPAKATMLKEVGSGKITEIDQEDEDGKMEYSADAVIDGKKYEVKVAADGSLISKKLDDDDKK